MKFSLCSELNSFSTNNDGLHLKDCVDIHHTLHATSTYANKASKNGLLDYLYSPEVFKMQVWSTKCPVCFEWVFIKLLRTLHLASPKTPESFTRFHEIKYNITKTCPCNKQILF